MELLVYGLVWIAVLRSVSWYWCGLVVLVWFEMFRHFPGWLILGLVGWGCVVSVVFGLGCV